MTKIDFQWQHTTELSYEHRTTIGEHAIEVKRIGSTIESEQWEDLNVAIESSDLAAMDRVYACLGHMTITWYQANRLFDYYQDNPQCIARWLTMLKRPKYMSQKEYQTFKNKATRYSIQD